MREDKAASESGPRIAASAVAAARANDALIEHACYLQFVKIV